MTTSIRLFPVFALLGSALFVSSAWAADAPKVTSQQLAPQLYLVKGSGGNIAAMLGIKVITLWGATHPYAGFKPFHQPDDFCITSDREKYPFLPTSVYGNKKVEGYEDAMRSIEPETIIRKIKKELN